jgi:hypothetical protein
VTLDTNTCACYRPRGLELVERASRRSTARSRFRATETARLVVGFGVLRTPLHCTASAHTVSSWAPSGALYCTAVRV